MKSLRISNSELLVIEEEGRKITLRDAVHGFLTRKEFVPEPDLLRAPEGAALKYFFCLPSGHSAPCVATRAWIKAFEEGAMQDGLNVSVCFPEIDLYVKS